jgi:hypothetical protein
MEKIERRIERNQKMGGMRPEGKQTIINAERKETQRRRPE